AQRRRTGKNTERLDRGYEAGSLTPERKRITKNWERGTGIILPRMHPILLSVLLGLTAAAANVFGGAIIVQKHWDRSYLKYFVALGAGFMLATALLEMFPASLALGARSAPFLVLIGYLIIHFFEHTVTPHFHFGEETHSA